MVTTQPMLLALLRNLSSRCPRVSDWRTVSGREGAAPRLVRFIDWLRSSERKH